MDRFTFCGGHRRGKNNKTMKGSSKRLEERPKSSLVPIAAVFFSCPLACDKGASPAPVGRSEQVIATGAAATAATAPPNAADPHPPASVAKRPRKLCDGDGDARDRTLPKTAASHAEAPGAEPVDGALRPTPGQWTWINFWAGWCGPCKEEIPRLLSWRERLARAGTPLVLVFVSLDDDERQLKSFLEAQPAIGLRSTLWLPEGKRRLSWLANLRMDSSPQLPQQALVDGSGRVRCFIQGAVEDDDYAEIAGLLLRPRTD
jgi:thiol-disulfide isomerase/thioredoxin